ncbi:hypothetical protein NLU13_6798 [Sarocladium strictum]|uniref:Aflatoxin regulatory protein domain-containing protein n=1 Tax=Sarocladium strictum TaxID=5046 RepID=A0AA39L5U3_SARSR|nr:hypothetical protein NLU13_6798 [Sarocladium strictum]
MKFAKALQAGMPLLLSPHGSPNQDTIENSIDVPGTLSMSNITHGGANQDLPIKTMPQPAEAYNQEMNIDPESGMVGLPSSFSDALVHNAAMEASNVGGHVPSVPRTNSPIEGVDLADCFGTGDDTFNLASIYDQSLSFSFSTSPPMDLDYLSHLNLPESEPKQLVSLANPKVTEKRASNHVMAVDPALQQIAGRQNEGHSCLRVAKRVQHSAIIMASKGETPEQNQYNSSKAVPATATTTDQALLMCSNTAKQLMDILRCRCESDAYLPFLLTVLISKVLATYSAIAKADDSTPFRFVTSPGVHHERQVQTQQPQGKQQDAFLPVPLKLGAYEVEEDLEGLLRAQMVLYELSKMECVAQLFAERYCHRSAGHDSLAEDCTVYTALAEFIKNRYARTKAVCELKSPMLTKT